VPIASLILFLLAAFYLFGAILEFPIMFDGNFKSRWLMERIGKKNLKLLMMAIGVVFAYLAMSVM